MLELRLALQSVKEKKAPGLDGISGEMLKNLGPKCRKKYSSYLMKVGRQESFPNAGRMPKWCLYQNQIKTKAQRMDIAQ